MVIRVLTSRILNYGEYIFAPLHRFYAKRCFLSMIEKGTKHTINVRDSVFNDCIQFLEHCESKIDHCHFHLVIKYVQQRSFLTISAYGKNVKTVIESPLEASPLHVGKNTVTYESRLLKALILRLLEQ